MAYYDPAAFAANQEKARQILALHPDESFYVTHYGLSRAGFITANCLDPVTLASLPWPIPDALPYPSTPPPPPPVQPYTPPAPIDPMLDPDMPPGIPIEDPDFALWYSAVQFIDSCEAKIPQSLSVFWKQVGAKKFNETIEAAKIEVNRCKDCLNAIENRTAWAENIERLMARAERAEKLLSPEFNPAFIEIQNYIDSLFSAVQSICTRVLQDTQTALDHLPQGLSYGDCEGLQLWLITGGGGKISTARQYYDESLDKLGSASEISTDLTNHDVDTSSMIQAIQQASYNSNALGDAIEATVLMMNQCGFGDPND